MLIILLTIHLRTMVIIIIKLASLCPVKSAFFLFVNWNFLYFETLEYFQWSVNGSSMTGSVILLASIFSIIYRIIDLCVVRYGLFKCQNLSISLLPSPHYKILLTYRHRIFLTPVWTWWSSFIVESILFKKKNWII